MSRLFLFVFILTGFMTISVSGASTSIDTINISTSTNSTHLNITITGTNAGWVGLGFGNGMTNLDVLMVSFDGTAVQVADCWATGELQPALDTSLGGSDDARVSGTYTNGVWDVIVTRPLDATNSGSDTAINLTGSQYLSLALGSDQILSNKHRITQVVSLQYANTSSSNASGSGFLFATFLIPLLTLLL